VPLDEPVDLVQAGLGVKDAPVVGDAQRPEDLAHLGERLAPGLLDGLRRRHGGAGLGTDVKCRYPHDTLAPVGGRHSRAG
jgi:hypothetical protein